MSLKEDDAKGYLHLLLKAMDFDMLEKEAREASNGDEDSKFHILTTRIVRDLVNMENQKAIHRALYAVGEDEVKLVNDFHIPPFEHLCFQVPKRPRSSSFSQKRRLFTQPTPHNHHLPADFKNKIEALGGTLGCLLLQKKLTATDMDVSENRLSLPKSLWKNQFLTADEERLLNSGRGITTSVVEPCLQLTDGLQLKKWRMGKSHLYVLSGKWSSIFRNIINALQVRCEVQIWGFRVDGNVRFAVIRV